MFRYRGDRPSEFEQAGDRAEHRRGPSREGHEAIGIGEHRCKPGGARPFDHRLGQLRLPGAPRGGMDRIDDLSKVLKEGDSVTAVIKASDVMVGV